MHPILPEKSTIPKANIVHWISGKWHTNVTIFRLWLCTTKYSTYSYTYKFERFKLFSNNFRCCFFSLLFLSHIKTSIACIKYIHCLNISFNISEIFFRVPFYSRGFSYMQQPQQIHALLYLHIIHCSMTYLACMYASLLCWLQCWQKCMRACMGVWV